MGVTRRPQYPVAITDGLIYCFDAKNRICWNGGLKDGLPNFTDIVGNVSGSGINMEVDEFDGAISEEGYIDFDGTNDYIELETVSPVIRPVSDSITM